VRRSFFLIALCATLSGCAKTVWQDATGAGRSTSDLQMASANCQLYAQANAPQADTSQCQQGKGEGLCVLAGVLGNVGNHVTTFNLCMQGQGWQQVKVTEVAQVQPGAADSDPVCSGASCATYLASRNDDYADDDTNDSDDDSKDPESAMLDALMNEGRAAAHSGDYTTAFEVYREAASHGDPRAENNIGNLYANGNGVPQSREKALYWFRRAEDDSDDHGQRERIHANFMRVRSMTIAHKTSHRPLLAQNTRHVAVQTTGQKNKAIAMKEHPE
jgi:hypothetical protein